MFEHIRFEMCRRSSLNALGSRWSVLAISGHVPGIGTCTSKTPCEYIMSSCRQAIKSWFWMS